MQEYRLGSTGDNVYAYIPNLALLLVLIGEMCSSLSTVITEWLLHPVDFVCLQASLVLL
jgi:hypothetical protein